MFCCARCGALINEGDTEYDCPRGCYDDGHYDDTEDDDTE